MHIASLTVLVLTLSGCAGSSEVQIPGRHAAPADAAACSDQPLTGAEGGLQIGTDWSGGHHSYGEGVVVYGCLPPAVGTGHVSLVADGTGITIRPHRGALDPTTGLATFHVTVSARGSGAIRLLWRGRGRVLANLSGPVVTPDGDGWRLVPHES
jgi:hypothetical protein